MLREEDIRTGCWPRRSRRKFHENGASSDGNRATSSGTDARHQPHELQKAWLQEIEEELKTKGLMEHIVPDYRTKTHWQHGRIKSE